MKRTTLGTTYIRAVQAGGLIILVAAGIYAAQYPPSWTWAILTALTAFTGAYAVRMPGLVVRLSVSEPIVFLSTLLFGPFLGTLTAAVDALVMTLRLPQRLRTPHRILFNVGAISVSVFPSALLYFRLAGLDPSAPQYGSLGSFVGPLYAFALFVFLFNSGLVAIAVSVERGVSAFTVWRTQFLWLSASYLASAAIAAILVVFTNSVDLALAAVLLPLIAVSFLAVRTTLGRLDDTNKHLSEVNSLYLSTIETLAMAIDAKDQVTHGHIRRVQRFAVGLARALGISDDRQIRAIEAAALLHDMGKLAIPEFILNKPGRLTQREFSIMKTHAAIGADLLSSIQFPYPVVPIVRHHHENWDGSGYPDGLRGADIPLGARILSVVDCYDALTSDRPYRPALPAGEALEILLQRRGRMYDPLVVDTFVRECSSLAPDQEPDRSPATLLATHAETSASLPDASPQGYPAPDSLRALASLSSLSEAPSSVALAASIAQALQDVVRSDTCAIFLLDEDSSDVQAVYARGSGADIITGMRIPVAERMTGWVAAHNTAVWNSDASLDLQALSTSLPLVVGTAIPLNANDDVFGVLTLYGRQDQEVTIEERRALETLAPTIGEALSQSLVRPGLLIDCADPVVKSSTLAALDALLAHPRDAMGASTQVLVVHISLAGTSPADDDRRLELAKQSLLRLLSPRASTERCVVMLDSVDYLYCALNEGATGLESEARMALADRATSALTGVVTPIRSSLELQHVVQRVAESRSRKSGGRSSHRIH